MRFAAGLATWLLLCGPAHASGFLLYEQSARAMAMGSAVSAGVRDPSAVWFDPAGLAFAEAAGASAMAAMVVAHTRFSPSGGGAAVESGGEPHVVPNLFAHARVADEWTVGLGLYAPFGLIVGWPAGWVGAEQSLATDLAVVVANPAVAWRASDRLAVAAGASVAHGTVTLATALPQVGAGGGRADLAGSAWGFGANVAVLFRALPDELHFAATYRSRVRLPFTGQATFSPGNPTFKAFLPDQNARSTITLPDLLTAGAMWRPHPQLELDAQIDWVLWSSFDELDIHLERSPAFDHQVARGDVNPFTWRLGAEWRWLWGLAARAGVSFDQSAVHPDSLAPSAPDSDRLSLGAGLGQEIGRVTVHLGYLFAHFLPAEAKGPQVNPQGTYHADAHVLALMIDFIGDPRRVPKPPRDGAALAEPPPPHADFPGDPRRVPKPPRDGAALAEPPPPHASR